MAFKDEQAHIQFKKQETDRRSDALASREKFFEGQFIDSSAEFKEREKEKLNYCLGNNECFNRSLLLDNDDQKEVRWPHLYDPDCDKLLFGRNGLPKDLWRGQSFYESTSKAHPDVIS